MTTQPTATSTTQSGGVPSPRAPVRPLLHVANLSPAVSESQLLELFSSTGQIQSIKIVPSRISGGLNYGFIEYADMSSAEKAAQTLEGWSGFGHPIKVSWAKQSMSSAVGATTPHSSSRALHASAGHAHVFVGDLSPEVDDTSLRDFFKSFPSLVDVRVMYDPETGKSRGFGFISFEDKADAERCIATTKGEWLGGRAIRVNWANQKNQVRHDDEVALGPRMAATYLPLNGVGMGIPNGSLFGSGAVSAVNFSTGSMYPGFMGVPQLNPLGTPFPSYGDVVAGSPANVTTVYVGNLAPRTTQDDLARLLINFGFIVDIRIPAGKGYAFIKLDSHEHAANAIYTLTLSGASLHGRVLRLGWEKERESLTASVADPFRSGFAVTQPTTFLGENAQIQQQAQLLPEMFQGSIPVPGNYAFAQPSLPHHLALPAEVIQHQAPQQASFMQQQQQQLQQPSQHQSHQLQPPQSQQQYLTFASSASDGDLGPNLAASYKGNGGQTMSNPQSRHLAFDQELSNSSASPGGQH